MFFFSFPFVAKQHFVFVHGKLIIESLLVRPSVLLSFLFIVVYNVNAVVFVVNAANTIIVVVLIIDGR